MKAKTITLSIIPILIVLLAVLLFSSLYTIKENEYAFVVRFSKVTRTVSTAGLHLKTPFIDQTVKFPRAVQIYDISPSEVLTADKQNMTVDSYVLWKIVDPLTFYKALGTIGEAENRLDAVTYNALKNYMGTLEKDEIIKEDDAFARNDLYQTVTDDVATKSVEYGISIIDVKIKKIDLPQDNEQAVYTRMISERTQMADKYTAEGNLAASVIRNNVDKQVAITISDAKAEAARIEATGESEYMRMLAETYDTVDRQDFYEFMIALDALKSSLVGENKTIIIGPESPLARILANT